MPVRKLTLEEVEITLGAEFEDTPVGGAFATDEPELDKKQEEDIHRRLAHGDVWAWARVTVTARPKVAPEGWRGTSSLGCCSYDSEEDFRAEGGYFEQMRDEALADLNESIERAWQELFAMGIGPAIDRAQEMASK